MVKPLQSLRLSNASGSMVTPDDPFIMAILSRQKNTNFGVAILNKMGDKGEQSTENGSVVSSSLCSYHKKENRKSTQSRLPAQLFFVRMHTFSVADFIFNQK